MSGQFPLPPPAGPGRAGRSFPGAPTGRGAHECPGPNGEPHLTTTRPLRRNLAAATTACTIVCTVLGGALISGNTTHAAPVPAFAAGSAPGAPGARGIASVPPPDPRSGPPGRFAGRSDRSADQFADRLAELRGAHTAHVPPEPATAAATAQPESAPAEDALDARAPRSARSSRAADRRDATRSPAGPGAARDARPPGAPRSARRPPTTRQRTASPPGGAWSPSDQGVVGFALAQVGKRYSFGHVGPDAFDCSGLVFAAYRMIGLYLPRSTYGLARWGRPVQRSELQPGDLVFPSTGHVGIYVGNGRMVHASTERGGVKLSPVYAFQFARRITG
ncbi:NlpC/P60 family protein [Dactylosporangium sp. CA-139066]|uniref:C40 family peptidase n=1 Tax=Dactylosporangium sp. CA-139066 TaxID=3239930 RepID=UPI003D8C8E1A